VRVANDFVISPKELRTTEIREQFRGYDRDEVDALFERAAATLESLAARARGRTPSVAPEVLVTPRELVDGDLREVLRGYHKDTVNDLADRAAATIQLLESRLSNSHVHAGTHDPITAEIATVTSDTPIVEGDPSGDTPPDETLDAADLPARPDPPAPPESDVVVVPVVLGDRSYEVHVGTGTIGRLRSLLAGRRMVAVVSQAEIVKHHGEAVANALDAAGVDAEWFLIDDGEAAKTMNTIENLTERLANAGVLRGDAVVAFGGGVVGDVAGFLAAVYHRGIDVVQVPTTLLAMVDSSIGGKTGVNLPQGKNLVGAFHQPKAVLADPSVLFTLPPREYHCGLGEVAKYALMGDEELSATLLGERGRILIRDPQVLSHVIRRSATTKAGYVAYDEYERRGLRAHLNYGHTLAHAIETVAAHTLAHGEAVAVGLVFAGALAGAMERIDASAVEQHRSLIEGLGLPVIAPPGLSRASLIEVMRRDKKSAGGLTFVLQGPNGLERVDDPPESALHTAFAAVGIEAANGHGDRVMRP
jgi:5-deoxy-5-amino-3-dehydroquinate synthase